MHLEESAMALVSEYPGPEVTVGLVGCPDVVFPQSKTGARPRRTLGGHWLLPFPAPVFQIVLSG